MGFGTLFVGYFLLLNITYFEFTDIIAAMIMLMALYKLSFVNNSFKFGMISASIFAFFSLGELVISILNAFNIIPNFEGILSYVALIRYTLIFILCVFILRGLGEVAKEVDHRELERYSAKWINFSFIYLLCGFFEIPFATSLFGEAAAYIYFVALIAVMVYHGFALFGIYKAFKDILMPGEEAKKEKKSGFTDKLWQRIEKGNREYAEYRQEKNKTKKGKGKK